MDNDSTDRLKFDRRLAARRGWIDPAEVKRLLDDLQTGRRDVTYLVWALFTLEIWGRVWFDGTGLEADALLEG